MTNNQTLPNAIAKMNASKVNASLRRVEKSLAKREAFEIQKAPHNPHIELRRAARYLRGNKTFAAFMAAIGADSDLFLNRERKLGYRSNLKGVQKVKSLVEYITGRSKKFDRVSLALFASSIIAAKRGIDWISNQEQEKILSSLPVDSLPPEVADAIRHYQYKYMRIEGDSRNQACQFRTTFDNLGCYEFSKADTPDANLNGIEVNLDSPVIQFLSAKWELDKVV